MSAFDDDEVRPFEARYYGRCIECDDPIHPGDPVIYDENDLIHADCADRPAPALDVACPTCNLVHPGACW